MEGIHISLKAEKIFEIYGWPVTNSILTTWIVMALLIVISLLATRKMSLVPSKLQLLAELLVGGFYNFFDSITGKYTKEIFPLVGTIFFFIITLNWFGLIPGVGSIGFFEGEGVHKVFVPIFRAGSADLNTTLAFALIAVAAIQYFGLKHAGFKYVRHFFNFKGPMDFAVGILELISEISRVISFAFRLFGNVFAGEVLLTVIAFLVPIIAPAPFLVMELFVGFIQALVFSMLTTVFISVAIGIGEEHH